MRQMGDIEIRSASINDLRAIMDIKNYYINNTYILWRKNCLTMEEMLLWWGEHRRNAHPILVAVEQQSGGEFVIGYANLSSFREAEGYKHTAENSIYLLPEYEGKGLGRKLMKKLLNAGVRAGIRVVTAWIDAENESSIAFHESLGYSLVGTMADVGMIDEKLRSVVILDINLTDRFKE